MSLTFHVDAKLKDGSPVQLVLADHQDVELLRRFCRGGDYFGSLRTRRMKGVPCPL